MPGTGDNRGVDFDQVISTVGNDPERARQALASGVDWSPEQRTWLESVAKGGQTTTYEGTSPVLEAFASLSISTSADSAPSVPPAVTAATETPAGSVTPGSGESYGVVRDTFGTQASAVPKPWFDPPPAPRRRKTRLVVFAVLAVLVLIGAGGVAAWQNLGDRDEPVVSAETSNVTAEPGAQAATATATPGMLRAGSGSYVCSSNGTGVRCWGANLSGEELEPTDVTGLEDVQVVALSVGRGFAVAVAQDGTVYAWGANDAGQLGVAGGEDSTTAVKAGSLPEAPTQLVSGTEHTCALAAGDVYCFGANRYGQVTGAASQEPSPVTKVEGVSEVVSIGTSGYDSWALTAEGTWAWGNNTWGQIDMEAGAVAAPTFTPYQ